VRAAKAVDYVGAGTIEFIADASEGLRADRIWFMEMNTRLQVEHPVTEEITGVDLVEWQLRVASGEPIPLKQQELSINGWAMEARLYAEDPSTGFLPSIGMLEYFSPSGSRIETGVDQGDEISPYYDPMIAKLISRADTRDEAIGDLNGFCRTTDVWPVKTNAGFLAKLLEAPQFLRGEVDTNFIAANLDALTAKPMLSEDGLDASAQLIAPVRKDGAELLGSSGFRLNATARSQFLMLVDGDVVTTEVPKHYYPAANYWARAHQAKSGIIKFDAGFAYEIGPWAMRGSGHHSAHDGDILSPMPGRIIAVEVTAGQSVSKGQKLLTLEAMKMEHTLVAPFDGVVAELNAVAGAQVQVEALLAKIDANPE
jgi:3-methylcrotonyl-CoA carboxylase alpha subunit